MRKTPPPKIAAPVHLDFVLARVFDMYRELAAPGQLPGAAAANPVRASTRKVRETVK